MFKNQLNLHTMNDLKKIIAQDIDQMIPKGYYERIQNNVMKSIEIPTKSFQIAFSEKKDNIILFFTVIFCVSLIYFFGYSEHYRISITIPKSLLFNFLSSFTVCLIILIFIVNDHFDRKKKIYI